MQVDGLRLANPVETADALLQKVGVEWQVEQNQVVRELEVAALAADFRADQDLAAGFHISKVGSCTVALDQACILVKDRSVNTGAALQGGSKLQCRCCVGGNYQHLLRVEFLQLPAKPVNPRVDVRPVGFVRRALRLVQQFRADQPCRRH